MTVVIGTLAAALGGLHLKVRIPTKPAMHSDLKLATYSDFIPATVPI